MPRHAPPPRYSHTDVVRVTRLIQDRLAAGASLGDLAAEADFPSRPTLRKWARNWPPLAQAIADGQAARRQRPPFELDTRQALEFLARVRAGEPVPHLLRDPAMPQRRALTAWKQRHPRFAAAYAAALARAAA